MEKININNSGVYSISSPDGKILYIGCSSNIEKRFLSHYGRLYNKNHESKLLQSACDFYGFEKLKFRVMFYCNEIDLFYYEKFFINVFNPICNKANNTNNNESIKYKEQKEVKENVIDNVINIYLSQNIIDDKVKTSNIIDGIKLKYGDIVTAKRVGKILRNIGYVAKQDSTGERFFVKKC